MRLPSRHRPRPERLEDRLAPAAGALDPTFGTGRTVWTNLALSPGPRPGVF